MRISNLCERILRNNYKSNTLRKHHVMLCFKNIKKQNINPFSVNVSLLYSLETSGNWRFSNVFGGGEVGGIEVEHWLKRG